MKPPKPLQQKTSIKEVMGNSIVSVDSSVSATDAAKMMEDTGVGIITASDLVKHIADH